jgi:hypothetical protein
MHHVCVIITEAAEENNENGNLVVDSQGNNPRKKWQPIDLSTANQEEN